MIMPEATVVSCQEKQAKYRLLQAGAIIGNAKSRFQGDPLTNARRGHVHVVERPHGTWRVVRLPRDNGTRARSQRSFYWFTARAALAMFAIVVQTMLPFVLATDIAAAANTTPICHVPTGDEQKNHQPNPANTCPICTALAATIAVTTPTPPTISLPGIGGARLPVAVRHEAADISVPYSYRSRAPPMA